MTHPIWNRHPGVRGGNQLTLGERAADRMRNGMGSWPFVFGALGFLAAWMVLNAVLGGGAYDKYPYILLNLVLSCVAALQGAILLIAAKRSDQISAELAQHDLDTDVAARELLDTLAADFAILRSQHADQTVVLAAIQASLAVKQSAPARRGGAR
jgi:uncharacterized membrane protein